MLHRYGAVTPLINAPRAFAPLWRGHRMEWVPVTSFMNRAKSPLFRVIVSLEEG